MLQALTEHWFTGLQASSVRLVRRGDQDRARYVEADSPNVPASDCGLPSDYTSMVLSSGKPLVLTLSALLAADYHCAILAQAAHDPFVRRFVHVPYQLHPLISAGGLAYFYDSPSVRPCFGRAGLLSSRRAYPGPFRVLRFIVRYELSISR